MSCTATVKWFDRKKGIGFATPAEGGDDIFVHRRNIVSEGGGSPILDENDTIYYDVGEHEGRMTAINVTVPIGQKKTEQRRRRGRNAKKELDAEAAGEDKVAQEEATQAMKDDFKAAQAAKKAEAAGDGGRDGKTRRRPGNRAKRNDMGAKPASERTGDAGARRNDKKSDLAQAARDSAGGGGD